jgi:hypothetical protein
MALQRENRQKRGDLEFTGPSGSHLQTGGSGRT